MIASELIPNLFDILAILSPFCTVYVLITFFVRDASVTDDHDCGDAVDVLVCQLFASVIRINPVSDI